MNVIKLLLLSFIGISLCLTQRAQVLQIDSPVGIVYNCTDSQFNTPGCSTACTAMATTAIAVWGTLFANCNIATTDLSVIQEAFEQTLHSGADAFRRTPRTRTDGYTAADHILRYLQRRYPLVLDENLALACKENTLTDNSPENVLRQAALLLVNAVDHENIPAAGAIISDGTFSRTLIYLRGDTSHHAHFILYDSHYRYPCLSDTEPQQGSYVGIADTIDGMIALAKTDARWLIGTRYITSATFVTLNPRNPVEIATTYQEPSSTAHHSQQWFVEGSASDSFVQYVVIPAIITGTGLLMYKLFAKK